MDNQQIMIVGFVVFAVFITISALVIRYLRLGFILAYFGLVILVAGVLILKNSMKEQTYIPVIGVSKSSRLVLGRERNSSSSSWKLLVDYEYEYEGKKYQNNKVSSFSHSNNRSEPPQHLQDYHEIFGEGKKIEVYIDPERPSTSVLIPYDENSYTTIYVGLFIILFGLYLNIPNNRVTTFFIERNRRHDEKVRKEKEQKREKIMLGGTYITAKINHIGLRYKKDDEEDDEWVITCEGPSSPSDREIVEYESEPLTIDPSAYLKEGDDIKVYVGSGIDSLVEVPKEWTEKKVEN